MTARITVQTLATQVATHGEALTEILSLLQGAQHSTPTAVADVVEATTPEVETVPEKVSAGDELFAYVAEKGLAFAKGGRSYLTQDHLKAAVRVLKTGKPEVLAYGEGSSLGKRGVSHIALGRADDGVSILTQFVYDPSSK